MNETLDGEFQKYSVAGGAYIREHFFGPDPRLRKLVEHLSDDDLTKLRRGGHDYRKLYAAYKAATEHQGAPTVILAKTVKGWTLGPGVEGRNITHQAKKLSEAELRVFRDRLELPIPDAEDRGRALLPPGPRLRGGPVPPGAPPRARRPAAAARRPGAGPCRPPAADVGRRVRRRARRPAVSTTMVFARLLRNLMRDPGARVAHRADHPRRGAHVRHGPALQGGRDLRERAASATSRSTRTSSSPTARRRTARSSRRASPRPARWPRSRRPATSYATHGEPMIPFYIFYSMFGFQRTGDQVWAFCRRPRPRLHDGRHRRPHDAERRGAPARGRAQPSPRVT